MGGLGMTGTKTPPAGRPGGPAVRTGEARAHGSSRGERPRTTRRAVLARLAAGCGALAAGRDSLAAPARGACPELEGERIRWLVGYPPGGSFNRVSRLVEPELEAALGAEVVVENIPGAGGLVGAHRLSRARPDGRTVGIMDGPGFLLLPYISPGHALDLEHDFDVLTRLRDYRMTLAVGRRLGVRTLEEVLRRRKPLVLGRSGSLGLATLLTVLFGEIFDIELRPVWGYQGSGALIAGIRRGEIDGAMFGEHTIARVPGLVPLLRMTRGGDSAPGEERVPALSGPDSVIENRPELLRDPSSSREHARALQTLAQVGRIVAAPRGLPPSLRRCLGSAVFAAAASPAVAERARRVGQVLAPLPAAEARRAIAAARKAASHFRSTLESLRRSGSD